MAAHPYFPEDAHFPGYVPHTRSMANIFGIFGAAVVLTILAAWWFSGGRKGLLKLDRAILCWWVVTGLIHLVIEGAFVISPIFYTSQSSDFLLDVWKEYSKADSRYASRDAFVVTMEAVTAFLWGPGSLLVAYAILTKKSYRHPAQMIVSMGQLYGDVLYFGTCLHEGFIHSRPEPLYFWGYFVAMNSIWVVVPGLLIAHSWSWMAAAANRELGKGTSKKHT